MNGNEIEILSPLILTSVIIYLNLYFYNREKGIKLDYAPPIK